MWDSSAAAFARGSITLHALASSASKTAESVSSAAAAAVSVAEEPLDDRTRWLASTSSAFGHSAVEAGDKLTSMAHAAADAGRQHMHQ